MRPTIAMLCDRIDVLAYHVGALEIENAALRRAIDRAEAAIDRRTFGTLTRRRIA